MSTDRWWPTGVDRSAARPRPNVGDLVAFDRRAWEVMHVSDTDPTPEEQHRLDGYRPEYRERHAPYRVTLRRRHGAPHGRENDAAEIGLRVRAAAYHPLPVYADGRVPLCSCCGHPWPCLVADQEQWAAEEMRRAEEALALLPGCCPACQEPVTSRQRSITFGGPNVTNPLAEGPTFHLRQRCRGAAARYEDLWVKAEPGRDRSLLTLRCEGSLIVHGDGSAECYGAAGSDCPSVYARHRVISACWAQSRGCGRGCPIKGHPGARPSGYPADPRAVTRTEETR